MNKNQAAAYIQSQAACALIEAAGMWADNHWAVKLGDPAPHTGDSFRALIEKYGIHANAVHEYLFVIHED